MQTNDNQANADDEGAPMSDCPMCGSEEYTWSAGCPACRYYDEDGHRLARSQRKLDERKIRKDERQFS